jgi:hypothetical protein
MRLPKRTAAFKEKTLRFSRLLRDLLYSRGALSYYFTLTAGFVFSSLLGGGPIFIPLLL